MSEAAHLQMPVTARYLNLPVKNGAAKRWMSLRVEGEVEREFEIELAEGRPDWWAFVDLASFKGKSVTVRVDDLPGGSAALQALTQTDDPRGEAPLYAEELRPQIHFSARRGWNNDPNGLVYHDGEYHLFFQHNPYGVNWGNMHWGHAVSRDLVHWQELDDALRPSDLGTVFSGSAVVDTANTAGFAIGAEQAMVCIYTAAGGTNRQSRGIRFSQCLAYSTDRGRTWSHYARNPVLPHIAADNRDPKVIWYPASRGQPGKWVMALFLDGNDYALFDSPNLKDWRRICDVRLPGDSECPEFFEIPVADAGGETRWVFYGGKGLYLVGRFDGTTFTAESGPHPLNAGNCFYASQTFNGVPDGRRILMPWGQVRLPGMPFNQMIGLPVELTLRQTEEGLRLFALPARELETLRQSAPLAWPKATLLAGQFSAAPVRHELLDITAEIDPRQAEEVGLVIRGERVAYLARTQELACGDRKARLPPADGVVRLRVLVDRVALDVFGGDGRVYMPMQFQPQPDKPVLEVYSLGGEARVLKLHATPLASAWPAKATGR